LQYDISISITDIDVILLLILVDFIDTLVLLLLLFFEKDDWGWNITIMSFDKCMVSSYSSIAIKEKFIS